MVKRKGAVWKHWTIITEVENNEENNKKKKHPSVCCNYCSKMFEQGTPKRMQTHLNDSYPRAPNSAKTKIEQTSETLESSNIANTSTFIPTLKTPKNNLKNITIESFVDRMSEEEQDTLEILLAQALFAAGVPFSFLENDYVIQFFQQLRQDPEEYI